MFFYWVTAQLVFDFQIVSTRVLYWKSQAANLSNLLNKR